MNNDKAKETTAVVTGLGLVCFGLFLLVSLNTNSPYDVMDYRSGISGELENKAGWIGAQMAHYAFCMYGVGAWVIMALTVALGIGMCAMRSMSSLLNRAIGSVVVVRAGLCVVWSDGAGQCFSPRIIPPAPAVCSVERCWRRR